MGSEKMWNGYYVEGYWGPQFIGVNMGSYNGNLSKGNKHFNTELVSASEKDCTKDTVKAFECADGHEIEITYPAIGDHIPGQKATCTTDQICTVCDKVIVKGEHTPGDPATCTEDQTCNVCGDVLIEKLGHTHGETATCTKAQVCTVCGKILAPSLGGHVFVDEYCTRCGLYENCGDVDGDGRVNSADSNLLKRIIAGLIIPEEGSAEFKAADIDGDGRINSVDSNILKRMIAGAM